MWLIYSALFASVVLEYCLFIVPWSLRKFVVYAAVVAVSFGSMGLIVVAPGITTVTIGVISAYRLVNIIRVVGGNGTVQYLKQNGLRTALSLTALQTIVLSAWQIATVLAWQISPAVLGGGLALLSLAVGVLFWLSVARTFRTTEPPADYLLPADRELPTLTVAVPARNETAALEQCLHSLVANTYPKLEIIVLDDCSQLRRTPAIIRSFAHDGVRFVKGDEPRAGWLAKNQAYEKLLQSSSGELVLFCGVDLHFEPDSLKNIVGLLLAKRKRMISVVPLRDQGLTAHSSTLVQTMRYWWELVPPRRQFHRPPVLSSCWLAERSMLQQAGSFKAVAGTISPEAHFARYAMRTDGYSFMRATTSVGLSSSKDAVEQRDTAIRTRYPQLHRHIEAVVGLVLFELLLLTPFVLILVSLPLRLGVVSLAASVVAVGFLVSVQARLVRVLQLGTQRYGWLSFPAMLLSDLALVHNSLWRYEFGVVEWKGRNVCLPVMDVLPRLPMLPEDSMRAADTTKPPHHHRRHHHRNRD